MFSSLQLVKIWTYIYIIAVTCMTHLPCQCFLTPLERKQHSIDKIDLPSSEGPTDHEVKHERTRLGTRRLNGIEIVAQFQQEESIMRSNRSNDETKLSLRIIEQSCCWSKGCWDTKNVTLQNKTIVLSRETYVWFQNIWYRLSALSHYSHTAVINLFQRIYRAQRARSQTIFGRFW